MEQGHKLQFECEACQNPVVFSVLDKESFGKGVTCSHCEKSYRFDDETLVHHLELFEALCRQIADSSEILGRSSVAIDIGAKCVKVPFNLLLTRLSSVIELNVNGKRSEIAFRLEPLVEVK
ncbi:MAG: hypothetical protein S4CHLAM81_05220 [Chlamydiales bacterium]|nr:hypothetical protein [Chlamydiales bacterium]